LSSCKKKTHLLETTDKGITSFKAPWRYFYAHMYTIACTADAPTKQNHIFQIFEPLDYCIGSNFWKFYLIRFGFILGESVSLVKVFRLEWIVLVFRGVWAQKVDVQHLIYWQGQCVCDACVLSTQIIQEPSYPTRKSFFQIFWEYIRTLRQCAGENWLPTWHHSPEPIFTQGK